MTGRRRLFPRTTAVAALAGGVLLAGCTGGGGLAGGCDPHGFGPLSGCSGVEQVADATSTDAGSYRTLASLARGAGIPGRHQDDMVAIAMAESSGDLAAVGGPNGNGTYDRCAWQINDVHGYDPDRLVSDPAYCADAAEDVYRIQGLGAWTVYDTGAHRKYLAEARAAVRS